VCSIFTLPRSLSTSCFVYTRLTPSHRLSSEQMAAMVVYVCGCFELQCNSNKMQARKAAIQAVRCINTAQFAGFALYCRCGIQLLTQITADVRMLNNGVQYRLLPKRCADLSNIQQKVTVNCWPMKERTVKQSSSSVTFPTASAAASIRHQIRIV